MRFFSTSVPARRSQSRAQERFPSCFPRILGLVLALALFVPLVSTLPARAATHAQPRHTINLAAIRQELKKKIRVTHTGYVHPTRTVSPVRTTTTTTQPAYNNVGISDDQAPNTGNVDGAGNSYSAEALQSLGIAPGLNITTNNITYTWPTVASGSADNYQAAGQVLSVPTIADAATVGFLGASTNGNATGTATLTYTDGTTGTFTLGLTDWTMLRGGQSQPSFGNTIVGTVMPVLNAAGGQQTANAYLFSAQQAIPSGKVLQSVTLPSTTAGGQLHIFAIGLGGPAYNNTGVSDNSNPSAANFDSSQYSYSAQALSGAGLSSGQVFTANDIAFTWPTAASGTPNNYLAAGQILPVTPVANATSLGFLGSAAKGTTSGTVTLTYTDGSSSTVTLGYADWSVSSITSLPFQTSVAAAMTYRNNNSTQQTINTYVFLAEFALDPTKTLVSVTLPTTVTGGQLHIFAVGTGSALNNVGVSQDSVPGSGNFDIRHNNLSVQALEAAGVTPGGPLLFDGVSFLWPMSIGGTGDNYQAAGQVIPVTPVPQASVLAFIGAATNGNTSGTATITYTDGSTQTFTLGMTDWAVTTPPQYGNRVVLTMPYHNTLTGTQSGSLHLFYASTSLQANKSLQSVTLPTTVSGGQLHVFALGTRSAYNNIGISDDSAPASANFDMDGYSYSAQDFSDPNGPSWNPGDTLTYQGINYVWPAVVSGQSDNYQATGQTIPITPVAGATTLGFVGAGTNGNSAGTATLTYTDGSTSTFTLGMSDWVGGVSGPAFGNQLFAITPHRNWANGAQVNSFTGLFEAETPLNSSKTVQSVTLPATLSQGGQLHIFMLGTGAGSNLPNNIGTTDDNNMVFGNYDGANHSYSTEALAANGLVGGQIFTFNGIHFLWPQSSSVAPDNYQVAGQVLAITPVPGATTLGLLGSSTNQASSGTAMLTYTDGSTQTFTLGFADWATYTANSLPFGTRLVASMSYRNGAAGQQTGTIGLFEKEVVLQANKTLQSLTLPATTTPGRVHVFSVGTRSDTYNNAGTSDDATPSAGNYDGAGHSYSQQALQIAGLVPGQNVTINGIVFTWPGGDAGSYNNDQAAGQTLPITPVANASTLAFLGSATNGNTSGTVTLTYTDGTTQTFTLGFVDWNSLPSGTLPYGDQIVATMAYRNNPTGHDDYSTYLFETEVALQTGKTLQSVTLPATVAGGQLHVFSVGTRGGALNNAGVSTDTRPLFSNFDGRGNSYSAQALQAAGFTPGRTVKVHGMTFTWPKAAPGQSNNYQATGQTILMTPHKGARTLAFLGASSHGSVSGFVMIRYTDGSMQTIRLGFADWTTRALHALPYGDTVAVTMLYHNSPTGKQKLTTVLFEVSVKLKDGKTVQSITLPKTPISQQLHVFAMSLQ